MQDLSPSEIDALSKAMGKTSSSHPSTEPHHASPYAGRPPHPHHEMPSEMQSGPQSVSHAQFSQLQDPAPEASLPLHQERFNEIKISIHAVLGRKKLPLGDLMKLHNGSVIQLDKLAGELIDIVDGNGKLIAQGEAVVVDEYYGIRILEIFDK